MHCLVHKSASIIAAKKSKQKRGKVGCLEESTFTNRHTYVYLEKKNRMPIIKAEKHRRLAHDALGRFWMLTSRHMWVWGAKCETDYRPQHPTIQASKRCQTNDARCKNLNYWM
jgi:hypothetical protein